MPSPKPPSVPASNVPAQMFHQIMTGIYFLVLMTLCVLGVKEFIWVLFDVPLLIILPVFHITVIKLFQRSWTLVSLKEAAVLDRADGKVR